MVTGSQEARTALIIGAGVVGMASAYALARRGWKVTIIDREPEPARGASHANGAQLSYCYTDALASPAILRMLPSLLAGNHGVHIKPSLRPAYLSWLAQFMRNCTPRRFRRNTVTALELARESREAMDNLLQTHDLRRQHHSTHKHSAIREVQTHRCHSRRAVCIVRGSAERPV